MQHTSTILTDRRRATILAALAFWAREGLASAGHEQDIATGAGAFEPMRAEEINALSQELEQGSFPDDICNGIATLVDNAPITDWHFGQHSGDRPTNAPVLYHLDAKVNMRGRSMLIDLLPTDHLHNLPYLGLMIEIDSDHPRVVFTGVEGGDPLLVIESRYKGKGVEVIADCADVKTSVEGRRFVFTPN